MDPDALLDKGALRDQVALLNHGLTTPSQRNDSWRQM